VPAVPRALTIAGSDSGGGAGIQADLKAFARCGVYGTTAITAVTAQNTRGIRAVAPLPPEIVRAQIEAVVADIGVDAVKTGMLVSAATIEAVARSVRELLVGVPLVVDPVLTATSGGELLQPAAMSTLIDELLPLTSVLTPNLPEARALLSYARHAAAGSDDDEELARALLDLGPVAVVLTGGHRSKPGDIYCDAQTLIELEGRHYNSLATHGSGCTHSAVLTAELARGKPPLDAARTAARVAAEAVRDGLAGIGGGAGPVDVLGLARSAGPR
jgi:hydroxymethylpyrimidine/phosphomethylpyrimidine kinase